MPNAFKQLYDDIKKIKANNKAHMDYWPPESDKIEDHFMELKKLATFNSPNFKIEGVAQNIVIRSDSHKIITLFIIIIIVPFHLTVFLTSGFTLLSFGVLFITAFILTIYIWQNQCKIIYLDSINRRIRIVNVDLIAKYFKRSIEIDFEDISNCGYRNSMRSETGINIFLQLENKKIKLIDFENHVLNRFNYKVFAEVIHRIIKSKAAPLV